MRVLNVNISLDPINGGGTAERTFQLSRALARTGTRCTVLTTDAGLSTERTKAIGDAVIIALPCLFYRFYIPRFSYKAIKLLISESDVIHLMNHWSVLNAIVYFITRRLNKPFAICPAGALPIFGRSRFLKKLYNWVIGKNIIRNANGHIAISVNEINHYKEYGVGPDKITLIPNGINEVEFEFNGFKHFRLKYGLENLPFILFIGRLHPIKGPDLLLKAFSELSETFVKTHLVFAGPDGGMLNELITMTNNFGTNDRVHFIGYIGGEEKSQAYHAADLVVIPSRQEAMSIVVLEAGITGTPVLITDQCGFDEVERVGGGKVVQATVEGIKRGLVEILGDPSDLKIKGEKLKKFTSDNFTWDAAIQKYLHLYHQILNGLN